VSLVLARIAQHSGLPDAELERTWPSVSLKELEPPIKRLLPHKITARLVQAITVIIFPGS
jgi:hypothetical protein